MNFTGKNRQMKGKEATSRKRTFPWGCQPHGNKLFRGVAPNKELFREKPNRVWNFPTPGGHTKFSLSP